MRAYRRTFDRSIYRYIMFNTWGRAFKEPTYPCRVLAATMTMDHVHPYA